MIVVVIGHTTGSRGARATIGSWKICIAFFNATRFNATRLLRFELLSLLGPYQNVKLGVRHECGMSQEVFSLYSEIIMRNLEDLP